MGLFPHRNEGQGQGGSQNNRAGSSGGGNRIPCSGFRNIFGVGRGSQGQANMNAARGLGLKPGSSPGCSTAPQPHTGYDYQGYGTQPYGQYAQGVWCGARPAEDYDAVYRLGSGRLNRYPPRQPTAQPAPTADERRRSARYSQYNDPSGYWQQALQERPERQVHPPKIGRYGYGENAARGDSGSRTVQTDFGDDPIFDPAQYQHRRRGIGGGSFF